MLAADRNLLFGILALQMDFVGRDELIAAMNAWVLRKEQPLGEVLVQQNALAADERAILETLVEKHLERHGGDAERSLVSVSTAPGLRQALESVADFDVQASLAQVGATKIPVNGSLNDPDQTRDIGARTAIELADSSGRFRLLRLHDRGGLGEVFVALDCELNREVAVKRMQSEHADDPQRRARFLVEAEITGGMEHPGIVPVYGLGTYADGRPFYAMRFIKGDNLKEAVKHFHEVAKLVRDEGKRSVERRRLLGRFLDVCNAVSYAHSRGVLHRDLKPGNIMLGKYGETLLVDWGLAKSVHRIEPTIDVSERTLAPESGSDVQPTEFGARVGTPAYMSPEQAAGQLDRLGPTSDVYSLGATLYFVLTGQPPFQDEDIVALLRRVERGEFSSPIQISPRVDPALNAICLKAMALNPSDRYESVRALAGEIEHWLADEPVAAFSEPLRRRAERWIRRHKPFVTGAASLVVVGLIASIAGTVLLGQANRRTQEQRDLARRQRDLVQSYFQLARAAVDDNIVKVSENTLLNSPLPGLQPLRRQLLVSAIKYYQRFVKLGGDDPAMRAELARAYFRLGSLTYEIGSTSEALDAFERSRDMYEALAQADPLNASFVGDLARIHRGIGRALVALDRSTDGVASFRRAIVLGEKLLRDDPDVADYQHDLAWAYNNLGAMLSRTGNPVAGWRFYEKAIATWDRLSKQYHETKYRMGMAQAYSNLGHGLSLAGRLEQSVASNLKAVTLVDEVVREDSSNPDNQYRLANILDNLGDVDRFAGKYQEGRTAFERAISVAEPLTNANPAVMLYQELVATLYCDLGHLLLESGADADAHRTFEKAVTLAEPLANSSLESFSGAYVYRGVGKLQRKEGRPAEALKTMEKAVRMGELHPGEKPRSTYELACSRALCSALIGECDSPLTQKALVKQRAYADQAIEALREAIAGGWRNLPWIKIDQDLDALRSRDDFKQLITELERSDEENR